MCITQKSGKFMSTSKLAEIVKLRVATVYLQSHSQLPTHSRTLPTVREIKTLPSMGVGTDTNT